MRIILIAASIAGAALVAAGAIGAHVIPAASDRWTTALTFGFVHVLAALIAASRLPAGRLTAISGALFMVGVVLFSGLQMAKMLFQGSNGGAAQTPVDALSGLVPVGGVSFIAAWLLLAASAALSRPR